MVLASFMFAGAMLFAPENPEPAAPAAPEQPVAPVQAVSPAPAAAPAPAETVAPVQTKEAAPAQAQASPPAPASEAATVLVSAPGGSATPKPGKRARPGKPSKPADAQPRTVKITSDRSNYLRREGVLAFQGRVFVDDVEFKMHADEVNVFLEGTNELKRIVAIGNVAITNDFRSGTCDKATYNRALSKIILYGDEKKGVNARLVDAGKRRSEVEGRKITFWTDTEQVEVEQSTVTIDASGAGGKEAAKGLFGK